MSKKFFLINHPIIEHKLAKLRNKETTSSDFRIIMHELSRILCYEATRDLELKQIVVETPLATTQAKSIAEFPVIVSVMRAGTGMLEGVLSVLPDSPTGHVGVYRDKFINATIEYYLKFPKQTKGRMALVLDPLLATADSAIACIDRLKQYGPSKIRLLTLLASSQGAERLHHFHPDVEVFALAKEEGLDHEGRLLPGLGDAGNRLFNTI